MVNTVKPVPILTSKKMEIFNSTLMNNLIKNILIVATSILYLTSCQNNIDELETIVPKKVITIHADTNNARTYIADEFKGVIIWSENDQLKVIENALSYSNTSDISIDDNGKAKFTVSFASNTNTSEFTYNAIFPASSVIEDTKINIEKVKVVVMNEQNPTETSFDPMADILVAKQIVSNCQPSEINMQFKRLVSIGKLTLKNLPADCKIHQVIFTAGDEDILAGRNYINTSIGEVVRYGYNNSTNTITMNYSSAISTRDIYFTCNPFEMNEDEVFSIVVVCDGTTYTRNVTIPKGQSLIFTEGNMASFTVDMENATTENNELSSKLNLPIIRWNTTKSSILQEMGNREPLHSDDTTLVYSGTGIEEIIAYSFNDDKLETSIAYIPSDKITLNDISDLFGEYKKIDEHNGFFNSENSTFANITSDGGYYCIGWTICKQEEISSAKNKIWYTNGSTTEATTPSNVDSIDANIISNIYDSNKECWVMTFDDNITIIDFGAFGNCDNLKTITLPNGIIRIGQNAFSGCDNLTSITIPDSVTLIGDGAFSGCDNLTSITIPDSVTQIGDEAFNRCSSLAEFKGKFASSDNRCLIVEGVLKSFAPSGLTEYTIPDGTTSIGNEAFRMCKNLTSVTIPDSVTDIGVKAFLACTNLTSVTIPDSVTYIGERAFYECTNLTSVTISKNASSIGDYAFYECTNLTSVTIPDSVTYIGKCAFNTCTNLTSVTISKNASSIGMSAFFDCTNLKNVYCKALTPPLLGISVFQYFNQRYNLVDIGCTIYVPVESVSAYKTAVNWKDYRAYIIGYEF